MKNIGLYFGTFNPIHVGHLIIANHMVNYGDLDEVWFVVSPKNPFKTKHTLLEDYHRLAMVRVAIENNSKLKASDIEFGLTKPSFTINTLVHLKEKYPAKNFTLIMGEDNLRGLHKWKNYEEIINNYALFVYPRIAGYTEEKYPLKNHKNVSFFDAPIMNISSSFIRKSINEKKDVSYLLSEPVFEYLTEMHFYQK
jgi:nicotinate-nucleotide adenylyltransferase